MQAGIRAGMQSWGLFFRFALAGGCSVAAVVGVSSENCTCAIDLFGGDEPCEFMGECDGAKREQKLGVGACGIGPSVGGTDGEDQMLRAVVAPGAEPGGELLGGEGATAAVGEDERGGSAAVLSCEPGEEVGFGGEEFGARGVIGLDALDVDRGEGFEGGFCAAALGARADVDEGDLHGSLSVRACGGRMAIQDRAGGLSIHCGGCAGKRFRARIFAAVRVSTER